MNLESNFASSAVGMPWPLSLVQENEVGKQLCVSSSEMRRMLSRDVHNSLMGKKRVKEKSYTFLTASQKKKDKKLILTCVAYERFSFSPRQFVSLKTKKTINNAGQNFATKSNRRFSSSYRATFNKKISPFVLFLAF